jgi:ABC-type Fe3+-hydroxamate transport system substrate-binding protein
MGFVMRRSAATIVFIMAVLSACGSDSPKTTSSSGATVPPGATATTGAAKGAVSFTDVCTGRAASKQPTQGQTVDYDKAAKDLQFALDHAPSDIKPDLTTLVTPLLQYYKILATSKGNFVQASQDPQFLALAQKFSQPDYQAAAQRVDAWYASHCS